MIINNKYRNTDKIQYRVTDTNNMKTSLPDNKDLWKKGINYDMTEQINTDFYPKDVWTKL